MALTGFDRIPIVDVGPLLPSSGRPAAEQRAVAAELGRAAREVGFVVVAGCEPPDGVFERLLEVTEAFFALPPEEKMRSWIGTSRCHRGYVPEGEEVFAGGTPDRKEAFDLSLDLPADDPDHLAGVPMLGPNTWPDAVPGFAEAVTAYYEHTIAVGRALFRGFAMASAPTPTTSASPCCGRPRRAWRSSTATASGSTPRPSRAPTSSTSATCSSCGATASSSPPPTGSAG